MGIGGKLRAANIPQSRRGNVGMADCHPTTRDWKTRAISSGPISSHSINTVDTFWQLVDKAGLSTKVSYVLPYVPDSFALVGVPYKKPSALGNATVTGFGSSDFSPLGLTGDGTTKRIETGWIPSSQLSGNTSGHICAYCTVGGAMPTSNFFVNGCEQSGTQSFHWFKRYFNDASDGFYGSIFAGGSASYLQNLGNTNWTGFIIANGLSGTSTVQRESGSGSVSTSGSRPTIQVWLHGRNSDGNYDRHRYGFWSMGEGFTVTELSIYQPEVVRMQRRFNRAIN